MTMAQYRHLVDTHRKNLILLRARAAAAVDPVTIYKVLRPTDLDLDVTELEANTLPTAELPRRKAGRRKGVANKKVEVVSSLLEPVPGAKTRSGRVSRPPRHIQRFYMKDGEAVRGTEDAAGPESIYLEEDSVEDVPVFKKQRRTIGGERVKCEQCGKTYVNERKLQHHVMMAHSEMKGEFHQMDSDIDCFNYLLGRLKKVPMKLRGKVFLDEMEMFVIKMHKLVEKLIKR